MPLKAKPGLAIGEIDAKSVIPDDDSEEIPRARPVFKRIQSTTLKTTTSTEEPLDEVAID